MKRISLITAILLIPVFIFAQRGKDGNKVVGTANTIVNEYTALTANAAAGNTALTVTSSSLNANNRFTAPLAAGDLIMIIQMQGASILGSLNGTIASPIDSTWGQVTNYNNSGNNEFAEVFAVPNGTTITLRCGLKNNYTASGKVQVIRVPRYNTLTVNSPGIITCDAWNGTTGGVCAIEVLGNTVISSGASISATGKGFRGGALLENASGYGVDNIGSITNSYGAEKGEGIAGYQADYDPLGGRYCKGSAANGGGGGNGHNGGGGGGANGGNPNAWNGHGNPDLSVAGWVTAWNLEYPWKSSTTSSGGGKGGYTFSSSNQNAQTLGPTTNGSVPNTAWGGDYRRNHGGFGGRPLDYTTGRLFIGGGGGAGDQDDNNGGVGGNGGGLIYLISYGTVSGAGQVVSNGSNGSNATGSPSSTSYAGKDGAGGGGAGGTIILNSTGAISGITASANGGNGGNQNIVKGAFVFTVNEGEGPGGGGGGGYIALSNGAITQTVNGGNNGTTNSDGLTEFTPNGATRGGAGSSSQTITGYTDYTITANNVSICAGNSTTLSASLSGNVPAGATIEWYSAAAGGTVLGSGTTFTTPVLNSTTTYYVGICPGIYTQPVTVTVTSGFTITTSGNTGICPNTTAQLSASAAGATSYSWSPAGSLSNSTIANPVASPSVTTTYTVTIGNGSCSSTSSLTVTVFPAVTASAGADVAVCNGNSTTLSASGGTGYLWSPAGSLSSATIANPVATPPITTAYTVTVTDGNGCTNNDVVIVTVNALPAANAGQDAAMCSGSSIGLSASGGNSYAWLPAASLSNSSIANPVATPSVTTVYTVTVIDGNGCTNSDNVSITVNALPIADAGQDLTVCNGTSVALTATGGSSYLWTPAATLDNPAVSSPIATPSSTTSYTVTVTDANGCVNNDSITVTITTSQTAFAGPDLTICSGGSVQINTTATGGFSWSPAASLNNSMIASPWASPTVTTTYTVTVTNANGCNGSDTVTVNVNPLPSLSASGGTTICNGQSATISATVTGGSGAISYTWSNSSSTANSQTVSPSATTTYTVFATDSLGCTSAQQSITVTVNPLLSVTASASQPTVCAGGSSTLTAAATGGDGNYTYTWNPSLGAGNTVSPIVTTTYTVTASDNCGSPAVTAQITVTVSPAPVVSVTANNNSGCAPVCVDLSVQSTGSCSSLAWNFGDGNTSTNANPQNCFNIPGTYTVSVVCTDANGCSGSGTTTVNAYASPVGQYSMTNSTQVISPGEPIAPVCFTDQSTDALAWAWDFGDGTGTSALQSTCYQYADTGTYCARLFVINANGCADSIIHCISIDYASTYQVPNVFSPNGDGTNDVFRITAMNVKALQCTVFNRWGAELYSWSNVSGGWDGRSASGKISEDGVYYYIAVITRNDGTVKEEKGFIQLLH
jgi:gliding motility-associated-like protein